jgi:hypothetical protein
VNFAFTEEQEELRAFARSFLADYSSSEQVRQAMQSELGYDAAVCPRRTAVSASARSSSWH